MGWLHLVYRHPTGPALVGEVNEGRLYRRVADIVIECTTKVGEGRLTPDPDISPEGASLR